jgi:glutamate-1-semialdehyde 2,1-aminomutase
MTETVTEAKSKKDESEKDKKGDKGPVAAANIETVSQRLYERAKMVIPGGVNSPVRSCQSVNSHPIFMQRANGSTISDVDRNDYIDYVGSWGPMILGHRHPRVLEALEDVFKESSTSYGAPCKYEVEMAELICELVSSVDMVRMCSSGTEACMSAVRLARAFTKRDLIVKFDGCYHGHADSFLVKAGSGLATLGISDSAGVPEGFANLTISVPFNDLSAAKKAFADHKGEIAAIIVEPIVGNAGLILPEEGFLEGLRELCDKNDSLLIFDEVMTGFRVARGGAQELHDIKPDLTCLGKIIGAGLPVGAYGGKKEIMEMVAPLGNVYQAGTLSGNPLAMAAGVAQLRVLKDKKRYEDLKATTETLAEGIKEAAADAKVDAQVSFTCGMISVFLTKHPVTDLDSAKKSDTAKFAKLWQKLLENGIYWPPSQFESAFVSMMHDKHDVKSTIDAFKKAFSEIG